ncbi:hypothetical protein ONS95_014682 [Cadophora gregata]|uniref:uncharacterized protein n=1 Tax=Cadophora gregata TaxID=51156 RepID=UPI0026DB07DE|nr:uncharacterized protein ONS95_014682 [Cadophora gregata]KAK0112968.1 hypothetical protein ONS95_014682 [Cadophora gregata]KAK0125091.1 hypothetical protein ONS96_008957 [Cadophora gregata f. sp. sojae]
MIHIDHSLLANATQPPPEPALPILASHLLELEEQQQQRFTRYGRPRRLSTGCKELDDVLGGGGIERGIVLGISAPVEGREGRLLSLHLLASALLVHLSGPSTTKSRSPRTKVTIIDTTGSFPLALLASVLRARFLEAYSLATQNAVNTGNYAVREPKTSENGTRMDMSEKESANIDEQVQKCLEMVAISRVFDIEGLWEVIGEVDRVVSLSSPEVDGQNQNAKAALDVTHEVDAAVEQEIRDDAPEILDSEEDSTPPCDIPPSVSKEKDQHDREDEGMEVIVVDNMTHIINELFARKEKSEAHTLLALLSSTLHILSRTNNILTILHNSTNPNTINTNTNTAYQPPNANQNQPHRQNQHQQQIQNPTRSIFSSTTQKPALGQIFAQFPDLHLLLHPLPKGKSDAELLYSGESDPRVFNEDHTSDIGGGDDRSVRYTTVLEVLKDEAPSLGGIHDDDDDNDENEGGGGESKRKKFAYREQKWTALDVRGDGLALVPTFEDKGNAGTRVEEGLSGGVGNVVKIWGFGGRRV